MHTLLQDLRYAARTLRKSPGFTIVAVLTLTLGIAANAVVFAVIKAILINPLPYGDPDRLVAIVEADGHTPNAETVSYATSRDFARSRSFAHVSLWQDGGIRPILDGRADMLRGMRVSTDFFETLGVPMYLGRSFRPDDDVPGQGNVLILTYGAWLERFGGDPAVVGRSIPAIDAGYTVLGVLPPDFHPLHMSNPAELPRVFLVLHADEELGACRVSACRGFRAIGRLNPGVTLQQGRAELETIMRGLIREYATDYPPDATVTVTALRNQVVGHFDAALWMVEAAVVLLLLLACANVGMLVLARTLARQADLAVRIALGAGRGRLVRTMLTESVLVAGAAGIGGISLAWAATRMIARAGTTNLPRIAELTPDRSMLAFGLIAGLVTAALCGFLPAVVTSRGALAGLRPGRSATRPRSYTAAVRGLIVTELALAFVLVLVVGLLSKSYLRLMRVDPGYNPHNVLTLSLLPAGLTRPNVAYFDAVVERTRRIPGVEEAGYASTLPLSHPFTRNVYIRERPPAADADAPNLDIYLVSPAYINVMNIPVRRGRAFSAQDSAGTQPVAMISESTARLEFGGEDPIGQHLQVGQRDEHQPWAVIVGIVGDVRQYGLDRRADASVYLSFAQYPRQGWASLVVRSTMPPERIEAAVRQAMIDVDPLQPIFHLQPMTTYISLSVAQRTFTLALIWAFGGLGFALATGGVYSVVAYLMEQRTREVGLRLALGASPTNVQMMILRQMFITALVGVLLGVMVSIMISRALSSVLFDVSPLDVETVCEVAVLLVSTVLLASYRPVLRAARADPMIALRAE